MARSRRYTTHIGFLATESEFEAFQRYLRDRDLTATEFLRKEVLRPLLAAQKEGQVQDDPEAA
jgi:hypothetical protein